MEKIWDLGWLWAGCQYWKKLGRLWATFLYVFFHVSRGKKFIGFFYKYCSVHAKKLHNISFIKCFFEFILNLVLAKNRLNIHNQLCIALLETPSCTKNYIVTLLLTHQFSAQYQFLWIFSLIQDELVENWGKKLTILNQQHFDTGFGTKLGKVQAIHVWYVSIFLCKH